MMKKVTAFVGSAHKRKTHQAAAQFLTNLSAFGDVECELVTLSDYRLDVCRGCQVCFNRGEEFCPLKDDRDLLFKKIEESDGVIFASPNYSWQMSGMMKVFLDRFGYAIHRPRHFGKAFTSIVTQGFSMGDKIVDYFDFLAKFLGFNTVKGLVVTNLDPISEKEQAKIDKDMAALSKKFHAQLEQSAYPVPSMLLLMVFRMGRTTMKQLRDPKSCDYRYYADHGWFTSDYYYPVRLGWLKRMVGDLFDKFSPMIRRLIA